MARLAISALAVALACHRDGPGAVLRAYVHHRAMHRCRRLLARSDAARAAGDRVTADRLFRRAIGVMRQVERLA